VYAAINWGVKNLMKNSWGGIWTGEPKMFGAYLNDLSWLERRSAKSKGQIFREFSENGWNYRAENGYSRGPETA
jgi:hypothetical protein